MVNQIRYFIGYWKISSVSGLIVTCNGSESSFNGTNITTTCTNDPKIIITK